MSIRFDKVVLFLFFTFICWINLLGQSLTFTNPKKRLIVGKETSISKHLTATTENTFSLKPVKIKDLGLSYSLNKSFKFSRKKVQVNTFQRKLKPVFVERKSFKTIASAKYAIKQYTIANGLPSSDISAICERKNGEIWFAFSGGVARVLSNKLLIYSGANGFPDYNILAIKEFKNKLYFATFGGGLVEINQNKITQFTTKNGFVTDHLLSLEVHRNKLYIGTYSNGLIEFENKKSIHQISCSQFEKNGNQISQLYSFNKQLFVLNASEIGVFTDQKYSAFSFSKPIEFKFVLPTKNGFWSISSQGELMHCTKGKCLNYSFDSNYEFTCLNTDFNQLLLGHKTGYIELSGTNYEAVCNSENFEGSVSQILVDKIGNKWLSFSKKGLVLVSKTKFQNCEWDGNYNVISKGPNKSLAYENKLGGGLVLNYGTKKVRYFHPLLQNINSIAYSEKTGDFWIITNNTFLYRLDKKFQLTEIKLEASSGPIGDITYLNFDSFDRLVISSYNFGLIRKEGDSFYFFHQWFDYTGSYDLSSTKISSNRLIETNSTGNIAFFEDKKITIYSLSNKALNTKIYSTNEVKKDSFLVSTSLGLYSFYKESFKKINLQTTLNQQRIYSTYFHKKSGNLYLSTRSGLYEYNVKSKKTILYNEEYGLVSSDFSRISIVELNGKIFWPSASGIVEFNTQTNQENESKTTIGVEFLKIKNNEGTEFPIENTLDSKQKLVLPHEFNTIEMIVHSNYWGRELVSTVFYKLDKQQSWVELNKNASIQLQNLSSGTHQLYIQVQFPDVSDVNKTIEFEIRKAFYEETWFITLCSLALILFVFLLFKRIKSYDFDKLENYNEGSFLINKTRLLAFSCVTLLLFADLYLYSTLKSYHINWYINGSVLLLTVIIYTYTHFKKINFKYLKDSTHVIYLLVTLILLLRCANQNYTPILSVEIGLVLLYSIFIYKNLKKIILFALVFFLISIYYLYFSNTLFENKVIYLATTILNFAAVIIVTLIESKNLSKVLFSDRLLQNAQQLVIVSDSRGNVVYINKSLLTKVGKNEQDLLGQAGWKLLFPDEEAYKNHLISIKKLVDKQETSTFRSTIKIGNESCLIEWKETPIDGKYILAIGDDITLEEEQRLELEKLSLVAKKVTNGVVILNKDSEIEWANESFIQLMEYPLDEILGKRPIQHFSGNRVAEMMEIVSNSKDGNFDIVQFTKSGIAKDLLVNENELRDQNGEIDKFIMIVTDITERKKEQEKYKFIVDNAADILYTTNYSGEFQFISPNVKDILGYEIDELVQQHFTYLIVDDYKLSTIQFYKEQLINKKRVSNLEFEVNLKDGRKKWVAQTVKMIFENDRLIGTQGVVKVIHNEKLKQIEEQKRILQKQQYDAFLFKQSLISTSTFSGFEQYLATLFAEIRSLIDIDRVSLWDYTGDYVQCKYANFRFNKHEKIAKNEYPNYYNFIEKDVILVSDDAQNDPKTIEFCESYLKPNKIFSLVDIPIRIDGKISNVLTLEETGQIKSRSNEELDFILKICDLIEINSQAFKRIEVEKLIQESETNFRLLNETLQDVFWLFDLNSNRLIYVSPSSKKLFGLEPTDFITNPDQWKSFVHVDDREIVKQAKEKLMLFEDYDIEYRIIVNQQLKWIHERFFVIRDEHEKPIKCSGVSSDITEAKIASNEIKRLSLVAEKAANGVTICDKEGRMMYANQSYLDMFEITWEEMKGQKPRDLFASSDKELHQKLDYLNENTDNYNLEIFAKTFKQNDIWIQLNTTLVTNEDGEEIQVEIINNITERKRSEQVIFAQNKEILASIRYAQRIQNALFTPVDFFQTLPFKNYLFYQPKDIVGGDFYWAVETENVYIIAIGDCTGHGVPGALMTSLAINGLINAVSNNHIYEPNLILDHLDNYILSMLSVTEESDAVDDGMDVGIISFDKKSKAITFSGAGRPAYIVDAQTIQKIPGSRRSIASKVLTDPFLTEKIEMKEGQLLMLFSDGITDQFNKSTGKKLGVNNLLTFLQEQSLKDIESQRDGFKKFITDYKKDMEQTDDMVLLCLKFDTQGN
jgi:PAS domain S-box-containing protein